MIVSALLPTRSRVELAVRSIRSLFETAEHPEQVEVLVAVDQDEVPFPSLTQFLYAGLDGNIAVHLMSERFGYRRLHEYYNRLAAKACGDWLLLWNDDAVMRTFGWDTKMSICPPGVLSLQSNHPMNLNMFPAVHRRLVEAVGHFSLSNHNDSWLHDVAVGAGCLHFTDIEVWHDRYDLTGNNNDQIYRDSQTGYTTLTYYSETMSALREIDIEKIKAVLR